MLLCLPLPASRAAASSVTRHEEEEAPWRATVLLLDFTAPGLPHHRGELAAEMVGATIEERGLARVVRPRRARPDLELQLVPTDIELEGLTRDEDGTWSPDRIDAYGRLLRLGRLGKVILPESAWYVEGTVSELDGAWWVRASLHLRGSRRRLTSAHARAKKEGGLLEACRSVAADIEAGYLQEVLERRSDDLLRAANAGVLPRRQIEIQLEAMHEAWPQAVAPAAARLSLEVEKEEPDPATVRAWAERTIAALPDSGADGLRVIRRLALDPYSLLAAHHREQGRIEEALRAHREAVETLPFARAYHWKEQARLLDGIGRVREAAAAWRQVSALDPLDQEAKDALSPLNVPGSGQGADPPPDTSRPDAAPADHRP